MTKHFNIKLCVGRGSCQSLLVIWYHLLFILQLLLFSLVVRSPVPAAPQQASQPEQELSEMKGLLQSAEEQNTELTEQLKNANATVEQYRSVVLTLEDSLKKEKEVFLVTAPKT